MSRIYIETTIPSFYHEVRAEPTMIARRQWTREWLDVSRDIDELVTSAAVLEELVRLLSYLELQTSGECK